MIGWWLMSLFKRQSVSRPVQPTPEDLDVHARQSEQTRRMSDELYLRLAERDAEHRRELASARLWPETMAQGWSESVQRERRWCGDSSD